MRIRLLVPVIVLSLAAAMFTACTSNSKTPAPNAPLEPATLQGQSEHWKVNVNYLVKENALEEVSSIQYLATDEISEATVTITHKDQSPLTYHVDYPELLKGGQAITLGERAKVASWKDTEKITVDWKVGSYKFTEYVTPTQKTAAP
ncbi:hypothetical protein SAMN03159341_103371 [Paenibacillus sp. 1_12]|uniref:hypothetical protein n=1 Tax=Paenibacillus sp. 1_12 TaxID=1566278 RepID=UPI0008E6FF62|nr:hypothetical protein [Paenibacillus sp. 1_12]SFL12747.1 hypothetical protein SAMN03159341_103371 [Paenibacillus sp. 1_12]